VITLVRAELLKLRTTRLWIVLLVASVAVVGLIIVANVNAPRIAELLAPDRVALGKLIKKQR
jgi:HAMP domain-containing protein